jgi:hypothetical protein
MTPAEARESRPRCVVHSRGVGWQLGTGTSGRIPNGSSREADPHTASSTHFHPRGAHLSRKANTTAVAAALAAEVGFEARHQNGESHGLRFEEADHHDIDLVDKLKNRRSNRIKVPTRELPQAAGEDDARAILGDDRHRNRNGVQRKGE